MAASPWPRPSTTASNTPSLVGWIRCRSPGATSPGDGRLATPQVINGVEMTLSSCIATHPFFHGDGRADTDFGNDVEIVHQQFRSGQTHAQPSARGVAVLHGLRDIGDARPLSPATMHRPRLVPGVADWRMISPSWAYSTMLRETSEMAVAMRVRSAP